MYKVEGPPTCLSTSYDGGLAAADSATRRVDRITERELVLYLVWVYIGWRRSTIAITTLCTVTSGGSQRF